MLRRIREAKKDQSGFTLIELLIVIVILGILAAVVVFAVGAFNKNGQQAACQSDFKSVEIADEAYFATHQSYATSLVSGAANSLVPTYLKEAPAVNPNYTTILTTTPNTTTPDTSGCNLLTQ